MNISIWDLDGTLADLKHRRYLVEKKERTSPNWRAFFAACPGDRPIVPVVWLFNLVRQYNRVEIWSGRSEEVRAQTVAWLNEWVFCCDPLYAYWNEPFNDQYVRLRMRPENDTRPDDVLKEEWLDDCAHKISFVVDDRDKVVAMWRRRGIVCLQAAPGDF